jgi:D-aminopeptidase
MPLDPELRAMLERTAAAAPVPMHELPVDAARLGQAGVPVTWLAGDGLVHGFMRQHRESRAAARARQAFADAISAVLAAQPAREPAS